MIRACKEQEILIKGHQPVLSVKECIRTRKARFIDDLWEFQWDETIGVERQLMRIYRIWRKIKKEEIEFAPMIATEIVGVAIPKLLKPLGKEIAKEILEYTPGFRKTINFEKFMLRLKDEWRGKVFGRELSDSNRGLSIETNSNKRRKRRN
ncbi:hypothetical protein C2S53_003065 [Perilla frutescens var. hirtella]|uniref:Uncharacterized protein n=1 Tax=Perilla frutescens var. hirtella TaxID=608512 RepID=A0AAD4PER9_PERFH|nr:hypothetical protein C2S53_003065 [Perilla frutescens var. hirtella]